jgi:site-specific DNA recombinase
MHLQVPRTSTSTIGTAYARYSTDFQHSILDQVRGIFEGAAKLGIFIPREHVFFDIGISGRTHSRPGLNPLRELLKRKSAEALVVFATNRLYRKAYECMRFVEEEIVDRGLRCVFVFSNIDTASPNKTWMMPLQIASMMDEFFSTVYVENIRAAHLGLFLKNNVVASLPFGFTGKEVPGMPTKRGRPRMEVVIDPATAEWVRKIYHWFVKDRLILARIVERLNDLDAPLSPRSNGSLWTPFAVRYVLANPCYRGLWAYGRGKNVWQSKAGYARRVMRDEPLREIVFEDRRIIDDEMWFQAQTLLLDMPRTHGGRKPADGNQSLRPRILNQLLFCKEHDRPLKVVGRYGLHMACPDCQCLPKAKRPLKSYVNRALALRLVCRTLADQIRGDDGLVDEIVVAFRAEVERAQKGDSESELASTRARLEKLESRQRFILRNPGDTPEDEARSEEELRTVRSESMALRATIARLEKCSTETDLPTDQDVEHVIDNLESILVESASSADGGSWGPLRELIEQLVGGRIDVVQIEEPERKRGWLRGTFRTNVFDVVARRVSPSRRPSGEFEEVTIDFREAKLTISERSIDEVMTRYRAGMLITKIADELGIERHQVSDAVRLAHQRDGLPEPKDGRCRRGEVTQKLLSPSVFEQIVDSAKQLYDDNLSMDSISAKLGHDRATVRKALKAWFAARNLNMPDGRHRRKEISRQCRQHATRDASERMTQPSNVKM